MLGRPFQTISSNQVLVYPFPLNAFCTLGWHVLKHYPILSKSLVPWHPVLSMISKRTAKEKQHKNQLFKKKEESDTRNHVTYVPHLDPAGICNWNPWNRGWEKSVLNYTLESIGNKQRHHHINQAKLEQDRSSNLGSQLLEQGYL